MKKIIRRNTFETNSSSAHTFVIIKHKNEKLVDKNKEKINITIDQYGWEEVSLTTDEEKINYIATHELLYPNDSDTARGEKFFKMIENIYPNLKEISLSVSYGDVKSFESIDDFKKFINSEDFEEMISDYRLDIGIDHQSVGILNNIDNLSDLMSKKSIIFTGNDNAEIPYPLLEKLKAIENNSNKNFYTMFKNEILKKSLDNNYFKDLKESFENFEKENSKKTLINFLEKTNYDFSYIYRIKEFIDKKTNGKLILTEEKKLKLQI